VDTLKVPPGNRLKKLSGSLKGRYSIRVNDQYRIVFLWESGMADAVRIADYH
jgi:proteic killer suppression protein